MTLLALVGWWVVVMGLGALGVWLFGAPSDATLGIGIAILTVLVVSLGVWAEREE